MEVRGFTGGSRVKWLCHSYTLRNPQDCHQVPRLGCPGWMGSRRKPRRQLSMCRRRRNLDLGHGQPWKRMHLLYRRGSEVWARSGQNCNGGQRAQFPLGLTSSMTKIRDGRFSNGQKRASMLLSDVSQTVVSALSPPAVPSASWLPTGETHAPSANSPSRLSDVDNTSERPQGRVTTQPGPTLEIPPSSHAIGGDNSPSPLSQQDNEDEWNW
jgi:hypothetical protein